MLKTQKHLVVLEKSSNFALAVGNQPNINPKTNKDMETEKDIINVVETKLVVTPTKKPSYWATSMLASNTLEDGIELLKECEKNYIKAIQMDCKGYNREYNADNLKIKKVYNRKNLRNTTPYVMVSYFDESTKATIEFKAELSFAKLKKSK